MGRLAHTIRQFFAHDAVKSDCRMQAILSPSPSLSDTGAQVLSARSLRALTRVLPSLYAETSLDEIPRAFADVLAALIPGESYGVVVHDHGQKKRLWHLRPATVDHEALVPILFANCHEFAPADHRRSTGSGTALALSLQRGEVVICAAVLRRRRGFRAEERELMNALRPHFKQTWANAQCFTQLSRASLAADAPRHAWTPEPLEVRFGLTPRESEVLIWIAQGKTNPEVAAILGIQSSTVRTHLEHVFVKLGVETRHAAGLCAIDVLGMPKA